MEDTDERFFYALEDIETLERQLKQVSSITSALRSRHHDLIRKNLLMEILLTMDVPRDRIILSYDNILWLLRNVQINNANHRGLQSVIYTLKHFEKQSRELEK